MTEQAPEVEPEPGTPPFFHDPDEDTEATEPPEHLEPEEDE